MSGRSVQLTTAYDGRGADGRRHCGGWAPRAVLALAALVLAQFLLTPACAAPHRQKRMGSDPWLDQRQTEKAMKEYGGIIVHEPVGFGKVDLDKHGRRRRTEEDALGTAAEDKSDGSDGEDDDDAVGTRGRLPELFGALQLQRLAHHRPHSHYSPVLLTSMQ